MTGIWRELFTATVIGFGLTAAFICFRVGIHIIRKKP